MKCRVSAANLKTLIESVTSIYDYGKADAEARSLGVMSVEEDGLWVEYGLAGAYIRKRVEAKVLRKGKAGVDLRTIQKYKTRGELTLDAPKKDRTLTIQVGEKTKYTLPTDQEAENVIAAFRPDPTGKSRPTVRLPVHTLKFSTDRVTYKPGEAGKKIKIQFQFKKVGKKKPTGLFSLSGNDPYSFVRYETKSLKIKVNKPLKFVLSSSLLQQVLKELDVDDVVKIWSIEGGHEETALVRFVADGFDFCHPVLAIEEFDDIKQQSQMVQEGTRKGYFVTYPQMLKSAFDDVSVLGNSNDPLVIMIRASKKLGVTLASKNNNNVAKAEIDDVEEMKVRKIFVLPVHSNYLGEFIKALPKSLPVRVEKWDNTARLVVEDVENGVIEYVVTQGGSDD